MFSGDIVDVYAKYFNSWIYSINYIWRIYFHHYHSLLLSKNYSHMSSCRSVNRGITILKFIIRLPFFPVLLFTIPLSFMIYRVVLIVTPVRLTFSTSPLSDSNYFSNPKIDSSKLISIVYIKLSLSLAQCFVGISIIVASRSDGAPLWG